MAFKPISQSYSPSTKASSSPAATPNSTMDIFQSLGQQPTATTEAADAKEVKAPEQTAIDDAPEATQDDVSNEVAAADETLAGETDAATADEGNVLTVKGNGKLHKFTLDKNDKKLQQTLAYGLAAPKLHQENKQLKKEIGTLKAQQESSAGLGKYAEAHEMASAGFLTASVKEFLGEEMFKKFYNEEVIGRLDYENATPEERIAIVEKRAAQREAELMWKMQRGQKGAEQKTQQDSAAKQKEQEEATAKLAASVLQQFDFSKIAKEPEAQEALKDDVWYLAMRDIEEWVERHAKAGKSITPSRKDFEKAFNYRFKRLTGIRPSAKGKNDVSHSASGNRAAATAAAKNYDKGTKADDIKGLDPLSIFKKIGGR